MGGRVLSKRRLMLGACCKPSVLPSLGPGSHQRALWRSVYALLMECARLSSQEGDADEVSAAAAGWPVDGFFLTCMFPELDVIELRMAVSP